MSAVLKLVVNNDLPVVAEPAEVYCDLKDAREALLDRMQIPRAYLWETIGKPMFEKGQKTKTLDGFIYRVTEPREREWCTCHYTLLSHCPVDVSDRKGTFIQRDALPGFSISRVSKES